MASMNIDLRVRGSSRVRQLGNDLRYAAQGARQFSAAQRQILPMGAGGGSGARVPQRRPSVGPMGAVGSARANLNNALASGDPSAIFDAQYRLRQAQARASRAAGSMNPPSFMDRLQKVAYSTRFGGGGGTMPLVGQSLDLLGMGKFSGPILLATKAVIAFGYAMNEAKKATVEFGNNLGAGGGTFGQTKTAEILGGAVGLDLFSLGRRMQDMFYSGGVESIHLRRHGYGAPGYGLGRNTNSIGPALDALRSMVESGDLRALQDVGAENLYRLKYLSKPERDRAFQEMRSSMSPDKIAAATRFDLAINRLKTSFMEAAMTFSPFIDATAKFIELMAIGMKVLSPIVLIADLIDRMNRKEDKETTTALDRNTDAIYANIREMRRQFRGTAGDRARGAVPAQWRGELLANALSQREAIALGAFQV